MRVIPTEPGTGLEFVDAVVGGAIPKNYVAAVKHGVEEAMANGAGSGVPIVDVRVECFDGKTHSVDSSDMAFKTAASTGIAEAINQGGPVLLEPVSMLRLSVPSTVQGDVLGDLSARRGRVVGSDADSNVGQVIVADGGVTIA